MPAGEAEPEMSTTPAFPICPEVCAELCPELSELAGAAAAGSLTQEALQRRIQRRRDLTLVRLAGTYYLVIACDSDGGIGSKPHDTVPASPYLLGRFAARVPLMEILASGARPLVLVNTLAVEMEPTGRGIIEGVKCEASLAGITAEGAVTGSTEDNVPTAATGMGVTVIGIAEERQIRVGTGAPGDVVACVGVPKSAPSDSIAIDDPEIADVPAVVALSRLPSAHDILPVGSRGVEYEARQIAASSSLVFTLTLSPGSKLDVKKSAGPSTCVLVSVPEASLADILRATNKPVSVVGYLRS